MPAIINSDDGVLSGSSGLKTSGANDGLLNLQSNGTTVVALTGSGISVTGTISQTGVSTFSAGTAAAPAITFTGDTNTGIYSPGADRIGFAEGGVQVGEFDASGNFQFNSGYGSVATAYGCRAWVNFNGTGTVAIRASGNVTSITDNGTGDYTVNFTTAMPDANYSLVATGVDVAYGAVVYIQTSGNMVAGSCRIQIRGNYQNDFSGSTPALTDNAVMCIAVFR